MTLTIQTIEFNGFWFQMCGMFHTSWTLLYGDLGGMKIDNMCQMVSMSFSFSDTYPA